MDVVFVLSDEELELMMMNEAAFYADRVYNSMSIDDKEKFMNSYEHDDNFTIECFEGTWDMIGGLIVFADFDNPIGFLEISCYPDIKNTAFIAIGVLSEYRNKGIANILLSEYFDKIEILYRYIPDIKNTCMIVANDDDIRSHLAIKHGFTLKNEFNPNSKKQYYVRANVKSVE